MAVVEAVAVVDGLRVRDGVPDAVRVREVDWLGVWEGDAVRVGVGDPVPERVGVRLPVPVAMVRQRRPAAQSRETKKHFYYGLIMGKPMGLHPKRPHTQHFQTAPQRAWAA